MIKLAGNKWFLSPASGKGVFGNRYEKYWLAVALRSEHVFIPQNNSWRRPGQGWCAAWTPGRGPSVFHCVHLAHRTLLRPANPCFPVWRCTSRPHRRQSGKVEKEKTQGQQSVASSLTFSLRRRLFPMTSACVLPVRTVSPDRSGGWILVDGQPCGLSPIPQKRKFFMAWNVRRGLRSRVWTGKPTRVSVTVFFVP